MTRANGNAAVAGYLYHLRLRQRRATFRYDLMKAVAEGYLVNPLIIDARTEITTLMLSKQGYAVMVNTEEGKEEEQNSSKKTTRRNFIPKRPTASSAGLFWKMRCEIHF